MTEIEVAARIPVGTKVRVKHGLDDEWDAREGHEYVVDVYVTEEEGDADQPYYILSPPPGSGNYGEYYAPVDALEVVATAAEMAALMEPPTPEEVIQMISSALHSGSGEDLEVVETILLTKASTGDMFESASDFTYGVEFYGRRRGGASFGGTIRLTGYWRTDD